MNSVQSLSHTAWECKYHVVWIPKYREKKLYGKLRVYLGALHDKKCPMLENMGQSMLDIWEYIHYSCTRYIT